MLIPLQTLTEQYGIRPSPVLHVGAHVGEEAAEYQRLKFTPVWWIEANPALIPALTLKLGSYPDQHLVSVGVADREQDAILHLASNGASSSILEPGTHLQHHPEVTFTDHRVVHVTTVDQLLEQGMIGQAAFVNIDTQGSELLVLSGAKRYLSEVQALYLEVNEEELYRGCVLLPELDNWLMERGFQRVATRMTRAKWGDALWVRSDA